MAGIRRAIVDELRQQVLGPRGGTRERLPLDQDPRDEYVTGILAPADLGAVGDTAIDAESEVLSPAISSDEDQDSDGSIVGGWRTSPALDPKALPKSLGLSFAMSGENPTVQICATWARYERQADWERVPQHFTTNDVPLDRRRLDIDAGSGVRLQVRTRRHEAVTLATVYLINASPVADPRTLASEECVFQPQIRIRCIAGSLEPLRGQFSRGADDRENISTAIQFRGREAYARGHLCSAVWRPVDPETVREPPAGGVADAPDIWEDGEALDASVRGAFTAPDARTEYLPMYAIAAPGAEWDTRFGPSPELRAVNLADMADGQSIRAGLDPLVSGYRRWIGQQRDSATELPDDGSRAVALENVAGCDEAAARIERGIDRLATDPDARLAFCFANRAIAVQAAWAAGRSSANAAFTWRPFQLAFLLLNVDGLAAPGSADRDLIDLLWFPTGGGKTEAYLGLVAFELALRRRRAERTRDQTSGLGTAVLSRYTLRLLTVQQFRRALRVVTACDFLRVAGLGHRGSRVGWRPAGDGDLGDFPWGTARFAVGLWVGGKVTPNNLLSIGPIPGDTGWSLYLGAIDQLQGARRDYDGPNADLRQRLRRSRWIEGDGEPAQVLDCPACGAILAIPDSGLEEGTHRVHLIVRGSPAPTLTLPPFADAGITIVDATAMPLGDGFHSTVSLTIAVAPRAKLLPHRLDTWWWQAVTPTLGGIDHAAARPSRPGYFITSYDNVLATAHQCDFDIFCPSPACELAGQPWADSAPVRRDAEALGVGSHTSTGYGPNGDFQALPNVDGLQWQPAPECFAASGSRGGRISDRVPISAMTVDDQVYRRVPSFVIATVDKFARLAYEPGAAAIFGNVTHYHSRWGFYREWAPPGPGLPPRRRAHPPGFSARQPLHVPAGPFPPPGLIIQDELHLLEGPLGSMVGLYETAIDALSSAGGRRSKYLASTATIREAGSQVKALFNRRLRLFPPIALSADDRFFAVTKEVSPFAEGAPGRLYVGIAAPGRGPQTPLIRIWASLLQSVQDLVAAEGITALDDYWTLVGYFNAVRELAGAKALYRQDIPSRLQAMSSSPRELDGEGVELSGRRASTELPSILERLATPVPDAPVGVFATSMFGTGVDVSRLGLMVVNGQPKTTSSYIQATGRVGRRRSGLVVTFLRASRPRDLDHYEFFVGYHRAIYRHVEPVTVAPFSPGARDRGAGPLAVALLRQARELSGIAVNPAWMVEQRLQGGLYDSAAPEMRTRRAEPDVAAIPLVLEARAQAQPQGRRPHAGVTDRESRSELDRWQQLAVKYPGSNDLLYAEYAVNRLPTRAVVLGDYHHPARGLEEAFENAPQSLREVEDTTTFSD